MVTVGELAEELADRGYQGIDPCAQAGVGGAGFFAEFGDAVGELVQAEAGFDGEGVHIAAQFFHLVLRVAPKGTCSRWGVS